MLGRFLSADTIVPSPGNPQSLNRYAYGLNNPLKYVDPSGHFVIVPVVIAVGIAVGIWLIAAPPAYAPSANEAENASRFIAAESRWQTRAGRWIDDHPALYAAGVALATSIGCEALAPLFDPGTQEPKQLQRGNKFHYDTKNGGPEQLQGKYPDTDFIFKGQGEKGPDVEVVGGTHPSQYPDSSWDPDNDFGDFKTDKPWSRRQFNREIQKGKLPPNTQPLPYDPDTRKLLPEHKFGP